MAAANNSCSSFAVAAGCFPSNSNNNGCFQQSAALLLLTAAAFAAAAAATATFCLLLLYSFFPAAATAFVSGCPCLPATPNLSFCSFMNVALRSAGSGSKAAIILDLTCQGAMLCSGSDGDGRSLDVTKWNSMNYVPNL
jgi:hypothetical protein